MHIDYIVQVFLLDPHKRKAAIEGRTISTHLAAMLNFVRVTAGRTLPVPLGRGDLARIDENCGRGPSLIGEGEVRVGQVGGWCVGRQIHPVQVTAGVDSPLLSLLCSMEISPDCMRGEMQRSESLRPC